MRNSNFDYDAPDPSPVVAAPSGSSTRVTIPTRQPTAPLSTGGTTGNNIPTPTVVVGPPIKTIADPDQGLITHTDPPPTMPVVPATPPANGNTGIVPPAFNPYQPPSSMSPYNVVSSMINGLTDQNSPYMQNATRAGMRVAANRGLLNGSIAAGTSRRASLDAALPLVQEMTSIQKQREGYASQDWLANNQFNREFAGGLAMLPIQNSYQMLNALFQYAIDDPATYTPAVVNQMSNFFTQNMQNIMSNYFHVGGNP